MTVRPITPEELTDSRKINTIAFVVRREKDKEEAFCQKEMARTRASFDEQGKMTSNVQLFHYNIRFDGKILGMGGVGGVASLPESRGQGNIRALMAYILREMYDNGTALSTLFPFSHVFYRQFGYEHTCFIRELTLPLSELKPLHARGTLRQFMPQDDFKPLNDIYNTFTKNANLSVLREDDHWKGWLNRDPYETRWYTYVWYDSTGRARAYAITRPEEEPGKERALFLEDVACADSEALEGLFSKLRVLDAQYQDLRWRVPDWIHPTLLFTEPYRAEQSVEARAMARVVNVRAVLEAMRHPDAPGSYTIRVFDPYLPENEGIWHVRFGHGQARAERDDGAEPGMEADIPLLTLMALGYCDFDDLLWSRPAVRPPKDIATFRSVFIRKKNYLADFF